MKLLVTGGRDFTNGVYAFDVLNRVSDTIIITEIIEGGQRTFGDLLPNSLTREIIGGADYWAYKWAEAKGITAHTERANWEKYGDKAGSIRNYTMLQKYSPDFVLSFPGGPGTANMLGHARTYKTPKPTIIYADEIVPLGILP